MPPIGTIKIAGITTPRFGALPSPFGLKKMIKGLFLDGKTMIRIKDKFIPSPLGKNGRKMN
jgi:hypothetical protein